MTKGLRGLKPPSSTIVKGHISRTSNTSRQPYSCFSHRPLKIVSSERLETITTSGRGRLRLGYRQRRHSKSSQLRTRPLDLAPLNLSGANPMDVDVVDGLREVRSVECRHIGQVIGVRGHDDRAMPHPDEFAHQREYRSPRPAAGRATYLEMYQTQALTRGLPRTSGEWRSPHARSLRNQVRQRRPLMFA